MHQMVRQSSDCGFCEDLHTSKFILQPWRRSYDDGDITPTNEIAMSYCDPQEGGGTLPRHYRSGAGGLIQMTNRQRPIAKVIANVAVAQQQQQQQQMQHAPQILAPEYMSEKSAPICPTKVNDICCFLFCLIS